MEAHSLPLVVRTAPAGFWVLAALAVIADTPVIAIRWPSAPVAVMTSVTFCFAISYEWGGYGAGRLAQVMAVLVAAALARRGFWPTAFDLGRYGLALAAAGSVVTLTGRPSRPGVPDPADLLGVLLAAAAWYLTFRLLSATGKWLDEGGSWTAALTRDLPAEAISAAALLLLSPMLILLAHADAWLIPLVIAPVFAVSQMARLYSQQQRRAVHDPLTGLPNRLGLSQAAKEPIHRCAGQRPDSGVAALLIADVTGLGRVNNALGHDVGNQILAAFAGRIATQAGPSTLVARLQGDEFAIFAWGLAGIEDALARAAAMRAQFDEPISVQGQPLVMSAAIGMSLCPAHGTNFDDLARRADIAMKRAKSLTDPVAIFRPDHDEPATGQLQLLSDLRLALEEPGNTEIAPFYQPQVDMLTGEVTGFEALLRWRHPALGMVSPEQIVRVAEHTVLMRKISMSMIDQVLAQLAAWRSEGLALNASVNVSVRDLHSDELAKWLQERLRYHGVAPSQLQLELTESALMHQGPAVASTVQFLRRLGVGAALDDFGTGFSSLQHLRQLPLTEIKIDRSFVQSMMASPQDEAIVRSVIDLGRDLGLRVVAEGIEDHWTEMKLLALGCRLGQGWHYARAMPATEFALWYSQRAAHPRSLTA
ncbi:MAG: putative bifunctional diguanylate cyclase/phosphodiesterase [Micromonosporaceae bacterium]